MDAQMMLVEKPWLIRRRWHLLSLGVGLLFLPVVFILGMFYDFIPVPGKTIFMVMFIAPMLGGAYLYYLFRACGKLAELLDSLGDKVLRAGTKVGFFSVTLQLHLLDQEEVSITHHSGNRYGPAYYKVEMNTNLLLEKQTVFFKKPWRKEFLPEHGVWVSGDGSLVEKIPIEKLRKLKSLSSVEVRRKGIGNRLVIKLDDLFLRSETPDLLSVIEVLKEVR
jgi:hypothetical protein